MVSGRAVRETLVIDEAFRSSFPAGEFRAFDDFVTAPGAVIKHESHSRVTVVERPSGVAAERAARFAIKEYRHGPIRRLLSLFEVPKGQREFLNLQICRSLGVPTVEPVAYGVRRGWSGAVRSSFVVTAYVEAAEHLRARLRARRAENGALGAAETDLVAALGARVRSLHGAGFFLMTGKPKNVLVVEGARGPTLALLDLPRARTVTRRWRLRRYQRRDLAMLLADLVSDLGSDVLAAFYRGYLPDPLAALQAPLDPARIERAIRAQNNETPWTRFSRDLKRKIRRSRRARRERHEAVMEGKPHG